MARRGTRQSARENTPLTNNPKENPHVICALALFAPVSTVTRGEDAPGSKGHLRAEGCCTHFAHSGRYETTMARDV